jgi:hypothetical protein
VDTASIGISKLYCPACSHLLSILRGNSDIFAVRGQHSTVYQVELPPWLPIEVVKEMVSRFEGILKEEIRAMMNWGRKVGHGGTDFQDSNAFSDWSTSTGAGYPETGPVKLTEQ